MTRPLIGLLLFATIIFPAKAQAPSLTEPMDGVYNDYSLALLTKSGEPAEIRYAWTDQGEGGVRVEKGILFTCAGRGVKQAEIAGDFSAWRTVSMKKGRNGVWFYVLTGIEGSKPFRYKFRLDGIWTEDGRNPDREPDDSGSYLSISRPAQNINHHITYKLQRDGSVLFRIYDPKARYVAIAGDFNNWNPEHDILSRNEKDEWTISKRLPKGKYRYSYVIDGDWKVDLYNEHSSRDVSGNLCSMIEVK
jgi:1,4-alpha-glucan branching enzyme